MLLSGVESLLDSSVCAVIEELCTGLPESISTELMAVSEPNVGLDAKSGVSMPVLGHSDSLSAEHHRTSAAENFCQKTEDLGDLLKENPHLQQHEVKSWTMCGTGTAGSPKSTGGKQASIQVTAETLPKLTEEVQGMKADGTRIVSKAGCRKDRVSKGLPPESTECPEAGTGTARAGLSGTSTLGFLEPLKGTDIESTPEHPQETSEYRGLRACAAMPLRAGGDVVPALQTREEKLRGQNPGNEFSAPLANCQTYQQDEESSASGEPLRLSSVESCRTLSTESSEVTCSVLKSFCYLDHRNMPLEKQSTAVHGTVTETSKKDLPKPIKNQALHDYGTGPVENQTSTSKPVEQTSVVRSKGLSSAKNDPVLSSAAASPVESSKGKFKMVPSEDSKLKKDQWQFSASDLFRDDVKTSSLLMEMSSIACPGAEQTDVGLYDAASEIPPPSSHSCLSFSNKPEKNSPEAQLFQKESKSNITSGQLADSPAEATGATSDVSSSSGKDADLIYTLNVTLPPVAQKSREPHCKESPPCPASEFSSRDKAQDNVPGKDSVCASGATREQVPEVVPHNDQFQSSGSSRTFYNPTRSKKISQKNMKPSAGNPEPVVTAPENEQSAMGSCHKWSMREQCVAANASCVLSGSTCLGDVFQNSPYSHAEVDKNVEENGNLEGEASAAYHSKRAVTFPAAHFPRPLGSLPSEDARSSRGTHPHGLKDTSTAKPRSCSAYTAEKPPAALVRGEVSNKSMEAVKGFDRGRVTGSSEIVCDNFGLCSSAVGLKERELTMGEKEEVPVLPANTPECTAAVWGTLSLSVQTPHTSQTGQALCPVQNPCLAPGRDFGDLILGSKQRSESLNKPPTGLQTMATSVEGHKLSICSRLSEEILLKKRDDLPLLGQKCAREDSLQGPLKCKAGELDSIKGVRTQDCLECGGFGSHSPEEKTIKKQESKCEREGKRALEGNASGDKPHCSQQHLKEQIELPLAGDKPQPPLPKLKLGKEQGSTVSAPSLPCSSAQQSPLCKPENSQVLSERENQNCLRIKPTLNNSCLQLTLEPSTESDAQQGIDPSHPRNCDSQESFTGAEVDSGRPPAVSWGTSVSEKEKLCVIAEQTLTQNCGSASARGLNEDSSVTKPLPVATSVKRKASTAEMPSAGSDRAVCFLNGAKSSRVCGHSKESLRKERHRVLAPKDRDVTSKKGTRRGEKVKSTCVEEKMGREVAPRRKLPINCFPSGEDCLGVLLDDSKESGSKTVPLSTENCGKVLDEIPRSNLNNLSKERNKDTQLPGLAGTSLLSEAVQGAHAEGAPDAETASGLQCRPAPTLPPRVSMRPGSCKEPPPSCVGGTEVCVPYTLHARSKDRLKGRARGQDTKPTHSARKERKPLGPKRLDQAEQCQVLQRKKQRGKVEAHLPDRAQPQQRSGCPEKAKLTLQPHILHSSELLCSSSKELVTPRNGKLEGPSEEIFAVRTSKNKPCSTLQEVKRPKTTTDVISSQIVKTQDSEMENLNLNLGYDGIPGAFRTTNTIRGPLPLKIQPGRTCKKVPTLCQLKTVRKPKQMKSSSFSEVPTEVLPKQDKTLLKSLYLPHRAAVMEVEAALSFVRVPGQSARRCSLLSSLKFRKCTKEPALLSRLSAMASKLLAPAKGTHGLEALPYPSEILPVAERCSQRRSKNLLEAFSCINRSLHSRWADSWCTKMFSFQPLALYPLESTKILFSDLSHKSPASSLDSLAFPVSFHIKLDSSPVPDLTGITSQHSLHHRPVQMASPPSEWTFSLLLSQSSSGLTALEEGSSLNAELHSSHSVTTPGAPALHPDRGRNAVAGRRGGYSMLGLHTVLALSSPGCYRIWTRRRNLTSHIPTIQRLSISQFAQGLKGARHPPSVADDLTSSLPYSLGRALSMWSQHGPSACLSEINPLHSSPCKWQPGVGIDNSYAMLPHLPVQSVEALQTAGHEIRLEASFPLLLPKPCSLPEPLPCPARLSASELQVHALNDADVSVPACLGSQDDTELKKTEPEKRPKKVSQIRIRKTVPKPDPNLTPMGLPKPKRLKKKEFSLEEIYTNKNYKSPPPARSLETIFEEPKEKNGHFISVSQQKRKRILEFQDFTLPRKRRTRGKIKAMGSCTRAKRAALQSAELDALLSQKLMDLEAFFAKEAEQEQASGI
ncbi:protein PRR14L isoform X2 [Melanerpes formicivorus]|uniref:protein PRR14L isoform X2 n=1 Tax=Melanerpes formicivorus TaxID=211600 RepID=UPI00358F7993